MLHLKNISKIVSTDFQILPLDLEIEDGKSHVLLGPSGCGKTTLLKIAALLIEPTQGQVLIKDKLLLTLDKKSLLQAMGYAQQHPSLFPHLDILENIALPFKILEKKLDRDDENFLKLLDLMQISKKLLDRMPHQISGGQKQRISIIRSLILQPDIVLLDEPLSALDPILKNSLYVDLKNYFAENNMTVLLVTHDLVEAQIFSDSVTLLRDGRIVQQGAFKDLANSPKEKFVKLFFNTQRIEL